MSRFSVAAVQMVADRGKIENLDKALRLIDDAVARFAPDLVVLPEYCNGEPTVHNVSERAEPIPGPFSDAMSARAAQHRINLVSGSFAEAAADGRAYNTTLVFDRTGAEIGRYRKTHLMKALAFDETTFVASGDELCLVETDVGILGVMVCYDLRFPEIARTLTLRGAEVIVVPAAFPSGQLLPPRTDHWDLLSRSTALNNLCYVVAANQYGKLGDDYLFGRSAVIDPWGIEVAKSQGREDIIYAEIDLSYLRELREQLPILRLRRPELYDQ